MINCLEKGTSVLLSIVALMGWWKGFKFRFRPYLGVNLTSMKNTRHLEHVETELVKTALLSQLNDYLTWITQFDRHTNVGDAFFDTFGFQLQIAASPIAGRGVFLTKDSDCYYYKS